MPTAMMHALGILTHSLSLEFDSLGLTYPSKVDRLKLVAALQDRAPGVWQQG